VQMDALLSPQPTRAAGNRLRRAAWILLFVFGLFFWIPALLRAKFGASASTGSPEQVAVAPSTIPSPLPTANGSTQSPMPGRQATCAPMGRLVLTTTILGKTRRAAIINGRLYREGDKLIAGSELYRLAGVAEDHIELVAFGQQAGAKRSVMLQTAPESDRGPRGSQ
jgi:hypothetical protein